MALSPVPGLLAARSALQDAEWGPRDCPKQLSGRRAVQLESDTVICMAAPPPAENGRCPGCGVAMGQEHLSGCDYGPGVWTGYGWSDRRHTPPGT
jgi:hypothetical protein